MIHREMPGLGALNDSPPSRLGLVECSGIGHSDTISDWLVEPGGVHRRMHLDFLGTLFHYNRGRPERSSDPNGE